MKFLLLHKCRTGALALALVFLPIFLSAQIVNIENRRSQTEDTIVWLGNLDLGFNLVQNGDAIFTFKGGINAQYIHYRHTFLSFTRFNLVRVDAEDFVNDGFQHLRYNYRIRPRLIWEAFAQAQYNEKINLKLRTLLGTGPRFSLLPIDGKQRAFFGTMYMYEYNEENLTDESGEEMLVYRRDHRLSTYLALRFELGENLVIASTSYYQPLFNNFADLRLSSETSLQVGLSKKLKFHTVFSILYDSRVPDKVKNTIYSWTNGIRLEF